jgi:hypothetical protein
MKDKISNMSCLGITLMIILAVALAVALGAFEAWILMMLWNSCLCVVFTSIPLIPTFWHSWGIMILCNILFGGKKVVKIKRD